MQLVAVIIVLIIMMAASYIYVKRAPCTASSCPAGQYCFGGVCVAGSAAESCTTAEDCSDSSQGCVDGVCGDCATAGECRAGLACINNACASCVGSDECSAGQGCVSGTCASCSNTLDCMTTIGIAQVAASGDIAKGIGPGFPACVDQSCKSCTSNADCGVGLGCTTTGVCNASCASNAGCLNGNCQPNIDGTSRVCTGCEHASDCATGVCGAVGSPNAGICRDCAGSDDCAPGQGCADPNCGPCADAYGCMTVSQRTEIANSPGAGLATGSLGCNAGVCESCIADTQCANNMACGANGLCNQICETAGVDASCATGYCAMGLGNHYVCSPLPG